jgi:hypothetical protein
LISIKLKPSSHIAFSDALFLIVAHSTEAAKLAIIHQDEAVKVTEINRGAVFLWIIALTVFGLAVNFGFSGVVKILHRESKTEYRISIFELVAMKVTAFCRWEGDILSQSVFCRRNCSEPFDAAKYAY